MDDAQAADVLRKLLTSKGHVDAEEALQHAIDQLGDVGRPMTDREALVELRHLYHGDAWTPPRLRWRAVLLHLIKLLVVRVEDEQP